MQIRQGDKPDLGATEACNRTVILALASIAGRVLGKPARVSLIGSARAKRLAKGKAKAHCFWKKLAREDEAPRKKQKRLAIGM